jgi:hypothetical protein
MLLVIVAALFPIWLAVFAADFYLDSKLQSDEITVLTLLLWGSLLAAGALLIR